MTQTFDIRFAQSAGLAAILELPKNAFRWKGGGHLRIDANGISIGVKRGLLALLGSKNTQRIPNENIRAVYREGDAVRVEFQSGNNARVVVPFWADNRDTAAKIVQLLPTAQTVEIEDATRHAKPGVDWRVLLLLALALAAFVLATRAVYQWTQPNPREAPELEGNGIDVVLPAPVEAPKTSAPQVDAPASGSSSKSAARREAPAFPLNAPLFPPQSGRASVDRSGISPSSTQQAAGTPDVVQSADRNVSVASMPALPAWVSPEGLVPIGRGMPGYEAARRQLDLFLDESLTLQRYFSDVRYLTGDQRFDKIEELWWKVSNRVSNSPDMQDPALRALQELELAISRSWRRAFALYKEPGLLAVADAEVEFAEMLEARARQLVF